MKALGIIRKLDELGRITLPIEVCRTLDIKVKDSLEIYINKGIICLKPAISEGKCVFCSSTKELMCLNERNICKQCAHILVAKVEREQSAIE